MNREIPLYIHKKLGSEHVLWFETSHRFIHVQEPAWKVIKLASSKKSDFEVLEKISNRYGITIAEADAFIEKIVNELIALNYQVALPEVTSENFSDVEFYSPKLFSEITYKIGKIAFTLSYQTQIYEYFIHPLFSHFEHSAATTSAALKLELFDFKNRIFLRKDGVVLGNWAFNESHLVKGKVFLEILALLHNKTEDKWLAAIHASAIADGKNAVLFSAEAGSGKTTISSLLRANGFQLLSDDFVPVDNKSGHVFPFPTAVSVKEGSLPILSPYFPSLLTAESIRYESLNKTVRFAPPEDYNLIENMKLPVKAVVFVSYDPKQSVLFEKVDTITALNTIFEEAWMTPNAKNAKAFLTWFSKIPCYRLIYGNNELAIETIKQLFKP